jgi:branched-chain amino acid transport system substrate-binding protein
MSTLKRNTRVATVMVALVLSVACSGSSAPTTSGNSNSPYRILMIVNLTGPSSYFGQAPAQAFLAASKVLNKTGGILNRPITITYDDDQGDPTRAVSLLTQRLNSGTQYDFCECGTFSAETLAMLPATTKVKLLTTESGAAAAFDDPVNYPYNFGANATLLQQATAMVKYVQKKGYKRPGVFISNDLAGANLLAVYQQLFGAAGIQLVSQQYSGSQLDFTAPLQSLQAQQPDAVILFSFGAPTGIILKNRAKLGWTVPIIAERTTTGQDLTTLVPMDQLSNISEQHLVIDLPPDAQHKTPQWQAMYDALVAAGPMTGRLSNYAPLYDTLLYIAAAAKQAGSTDPDKVKAALENLKAPNPVPWVTFPNGPGFTTKEHFAVATDADWTFTGLTKLDNGLVKPAA